MHALSVCVMIRPIADRQIDQNDGVDTLARGEQDVKN